MKTCRRCGAALAENAAYCMQCGTSADSAAAPETPLPAGVFLGPALLAGTVIGVLNSVPLLDCLCCAWMLGGGAAAAWLVGRNCPGRAGGLAYGDGAFAGVLTGVWAALVATAATMLPRFLVPGIGERQMESLEGLLSNYPAEVAAELRELMTVLFSDPPSLFAVMLTLVPNLLLNGLFAMLGGIILVGVLRRPTGRRRQGHD